VATRPEKRSLEGMAPDQVEQSVTGRSDKAPALRDRFLLSFVVLSGVGGRAASDNAVEGSLARGDCRWRRAEFSPSSGEQ
jgi:hypothetical protein